MFQGDGTEPLYWLWETDDNDPELSKDSELVNIAVERVFMDRITKAVVEVLEVTHPGCPDCEKRHSCAEIHEQIQELTRTALKDILGEVAVLN